MKNSWFITIALATTAWPALAQQCDDTVEKAFEHSTNVVAAEAISVRTEFAGHPLDRTKPREVQVVSWIVLESWKGDKKAKDLFDTHTVVNISREDGRSVSQNEAYLLYQMDPSWVSTCSRSSVLKHAIRDIPVLYRLAKDIKAGT